MSVKVKDAVNCYIGLGSNLNNPVRQVSSAAEEIAGLADIEVVALSPLYRSQPVGPQNQADYINAVMHIRTRLAPLDLLQQLQSLENTHGRVRDKHWGPRTLDLDILLYSDACIDLPELKVPHPEMANRAFVLYPLADIAPSDLLIGDKLSLKDLLNTCPVQGIQRLSAS